MRVGASAAPSSILGREVGISPSRIIPPTDSVEGINIGRRNLTRLEPTRRGGLVVVVVVVVVVCVCVCVCMCVYVCVCVCIKFILKSIGWP